MPFDIRQFNRKSEEHPKRNVKTSNPRIFAESIFPKAFGTAAQNSYMESQDAFSSLFADQAKYNAIMHALSSIIYREMRIDWIIQIYNKHKSIPVTLCFWY